MKLESATTIEPTWTCGKITSDDQQEFKPKVNVLVQHCMARETTHFKLHTLFQLHFKNITDV